MANFIGEVPAKGIKITKAICDSDLDGVVCGALLGSVFGDIKFILADPKNIKEGLFDKIVDQNTVIADLGYIEGCGLYFDHHTSNEPEIGTKIIGRWENTPSATKIIYDFYKNDFDLSKYKDLVDFVNHYDSGDVSKMEVEHPNECMNLAFAITRKDKAFDLEAIKALRNMQDLKSFFKEPIISERIALYNKYQKDYYKFLSSHVEITNNIAFVDNRDFINDITHAYFVNVLYPDTDFVVMIKENIQNPKLINLTLSRNNFNSKVKEFNLLKIVRKLNPSISGGHEFACGVTLPEEMSLEEAKKKILETVETFQ